MKYNDKFYPTNFKKLLEILLNQLRKDEVLGLPRELFFEPKKDDFFKTSYINQAIDSPIGVAAGPQTQLAQNLIIAWLAGARFLELKTVQTLDEIEVSKPCIDMQEEGYNCEWSQELKIQRAFDEYVNAWIIIHILQHELGFKDFGTIFNMSVGYDFKGIMKPNVQWFLDKMTNAKTEIEQKCNEIRDIYPKIEQINIPAQITNNITLSTMHGCPPEEVEQIAGYLIAVRKLNTIVKLNPTLLGKETVRNILKNSGFKTNVPDIAFEHDLKYIDAIALIKRLTDLASKNNVFFGIKLTNTLESENNKNIFDKENAMMYMSGKPLHLIAINLANKLQKEFKGRLNVSFSAGVDAFNIAETISCGFKPITICSDLLKPGGYGRLHQYYDILRNIDKNAKNIDQFIVNKAVLESKDVNTCKLHNLDEYAQKVLKNSYYKKASFADLSIKTDRKLEKFDCIAAPCQTTCPTNQNVPEYMYLVQQNRFDEAFNTIIADNPFPTVTGYICDHQCQEKCTRINYDKSLNIRDIKRFVADNAAKNFEKKELNKTQNIAIIGAGPAGLSAAYFLLQHGYKVEIFEKNANPGGMVANAIPYFRLPDRQVEIDINRIVELGAVVHYNYFVDKDNFADITEKFSFVFVGAGASKALTIGLEQDGVAGVWDPLEFLYQTRTNFSLNIGKKVAVIGGGNTAMDAARIAKRLIPADGKVTILYRRSIEQMPAHSHEIVDTINDGVDIMELVDPLELITENKKLKAIKLIRTKLVKVEGQGRLIPEKIANSEFELDFDSVIVATGQQKGFDFLSDKAYKNYHIPTTKFPNIYIGGDAVRGAASAIKAIADGKHAAFEIIKKIENDFSDKILKKEKNVKYKELKIKKATRIFPEEKYVKAVSKPNDFTLISETYTKEEAQKEAERCLLCDELCDVCVSVCPNLANQSYDVKSETITLPVLEVKDKKYSIAGNSVFSVKQQHQTFNIADWCNECANCETFCPTAGKPYLDKPKVHLSLQSFNESPFGYYFENNKIICKEDSEIYELEIDNEKYICSNSKFTAHFDKYWNFVNIDIKGDVESVNFSKFAEMYFLRNIKEKFSMPKYCD